jgi:hypothetical protein
MNPYEAAAERVERARKARAALKELTAWLDDEERAAEANLSEHEESPGIPLAQYRTHEAL